ncbi:MAG TPA: YtxH domain-containing protein [Gemmatimonadales bacterium]|nr:YtxH domain-containing protein [Gemmatimonadales bacterium]
MARHHDDGDDEVVERRGSPIAPFLWGLAAGAALGLLFAPMSGAELRADLRSRSRKFRDLATQKVDEIEDLVAGSYEQARERVEQGIDSAKRSVQEGRQAARDVVQAGREAAATAREELEKRLADARHARRAGRHGASAADDEPGA